MGAGCRGSRFAARSKRAGRGGPSSPANEAAEDHVVEEVLARQVDTGEGAGRIGSRRQDRVHGRERTFEAGPVVVEHPRAHVGRGADGVESGLPEPSEHREGLVARTGAVVYRGDPVAVQIDEPGPGHAGWSSTGGRAVRASTATSTSTPTSTPTSTCDPDLDLRPRLSTSTPMRWVVHVCGSMPSAKRPRQLLAVRGRPSSAVTVFSLGGGMAPQT